MKFHPAIKLIVMLVLLIGAVQPVLGQSDPDCVNGICDRIPDVTEGLAVAGTTAFAPIFAPAAVTPAGTIIVSTTADEFGTGGACSLREAVQAANTNTNFSGCTRSGSAPYQIVLPAATYTLTLTGAGEDSNATGDLDVTVSLELAGNGSTIDGNNADRIFDIRSGVNVDFDSVNMVDGQVSGNGGAIQANSNAIIEITNSRFANNQANNGGAIVLSTSGGGSGEVIVDNSVFENNTATNTLGGALFVRVATISDSVFRDNQATQGSAIAVTALPSATSFLNILRTTFNNNIGGGGAGAINSIIPTNIANSTFVSNTGGDGSALRAAVIDAGENYTFSITGSTFYNNTNDPPLRLAGGSGTANLVLRGNIILNDTALNPIRANGTNTITSNGFNVIGSVNNFNFAANTTDDVYGDPNNTTTPNAGAIEIPSAITPSGVIATALANNGGQTVAFGTFIQTLALSNSSPAINRFANCLYASNGTNPLFTNGAGITTDQRLQARPFGGVCDSGAYERQSAAVTPQFSINDISVAEGAGTATLTVTLSADPGVTVTVDVQTANNTAVQPSDYTTNTTTLTFTHGGALTQSFNVTVIDDSSVEPSEQLFANLSNVSFGAAINDSQGIITITDNDVAGVTLAQSGGSTNITEGGATDTYTLVLTSIPANQVTITATPDAQCNLGAGAGVAINLTFNTDATAMNPQTVTVAAVDDAIAEGLHSCVITHTVASGDGNYNAIAVPSVISAITDNDIAGITITAPLANINEEGATSTTFTLAANTPPTANVTVPVTPDAQCDLGAGAGNLINVTLPLNVTTAQTVTVTAVNDATSETATHTCTITTGNPTSGDGQYDALDAASVADTSANVLDNDITFTVTNSGATNEGTGSNTTVTFTITPDALGAIVNVGGTVDYTVTAPGADAADYVSLPSGTLTFLAGGAAQTVMVDVIGDSIDEADFTLNFASTGATSGTTGTVTVNGAPSVVNVTDDDTAGVTVTESGGTTDITEGGTTDNYTVVLTSVPTAGVTITATPDAQCNLGAGAGVAINLIFNADATALNPQTVTVTALDDLAVEGPHTCIITHTAASGDANYSGIAVTGVTANITDNDTASVTVTESGGTTDIAEGGATDDYTVALTSVPTALVTITVTPDAQCDLGAGVGVAINLTFNADATALNPQTVTVTALDDAIAEGLHTCGITHTAASGDGNYNAIGVAGVAANVTDNDVAGITVTVPLATIDEDDVATTTTFTLAANTPPTANVDVALSTDGQCTVPATVTLTASNTTPVLVTVTAVDDATSETATHTCTITTGNVTSADTEYDALDGSTVVDATANVLDNDIAFTVTNSGAAMEGTGSNTTVTFTVTPDALGAILNVGGTVDYTVTAPGADAADYVSLPSGTLTFTAGVTTAQDVTVEVVGDSITEVNFTLELTSSGTTSGTTGTGAVNSVPSVVNVADDDTAGIAIMQSGGSTDIAEGGATDAVTVLLNTQPDSSADVSLDITPDAQCEIDGSGAGTTVTITVLNADWNIGTVFTVSAIDDTVAEGTHICVLTVSTPTSIDANYNGIGVPYTLDAVTFDPSVDTISVNITDNDIPGATFSALTLVEGTTGTYMIVLNTLPADTVTVDAITPDVQCTVNTATPLTFTTTDWDIPQTISVTAVDDGSGEGAHNCVITHTLTSIDADYTGDFDHNITITENIDTTLASILIDTNAIGVSEDVAIPGDEVTWTFTVTNISAETLNSVVARVTYPDDDMVGVTATSSTGVNGAFSHGSLLTDYALGSMSAGETITLTITTRLPDRAATYIGILTVTADGVLQADTSTLTLLSVGELPSTGETPLWRGWLIALVMIVLGGSLISGMYSLIVRRI